MDDRSELFVELVLSELDLTHIRVVDPANLKVFAEDLIACHKYSLRGRICKYRRTVRALRLRG